MGEWLPGKQREIWLFGHSTVRPVRARRARDVNMRARFFQIAAHEGHSKAIEYKARCEAEASGHKLAAAEMRKQQERQDARVERTIALRKEADAHAMAYAAALENKQLLASRQAYAWHSACKCRERCAGKTCEPGESAQQAFPGGRLWRHVACQHGVNRPHLGRRFMGCSNYRTKGCGHFHWLNAAAATADAAASGAADNPVEGSSR